LTITDRPIGDFVSPKPSEPNRLKAGVEGRTRKGIAILDIEVILKQVKGKKLKEFMQYIFGRTSSHSRAEYKPLNFYSW